MHFFCYIVLYFGFISPTKILKIPKIKDGEKHNVKLTHNSSVSTSSFSVCLWFKTNFDIWTLHLESPGGWTMIINDYGKRGEELFFWFGLQEQSFMHDIDLPNNNSIMPYFWTFICFTFDSDADNIALYLNSDLIYSKSTRSEQYLVQNTSLSSFLILIGNYTEGMDNYGITGLNVWSRVLTRNEVEDVFLCKENYKKSILLHWDNISMQVQPPNDAFKIEDLDNEEETCKENKENHYVIDVKASMGNSREAIRICNALDGTMSPFKSEKELNQLEISEKEVWVPIFKDNDIWKDAKNVQVSFLPWNRGGPFEGKNCVLHYKTVYYATDCNSHRHFYCKMKSQIAFRLRGHI